MIGISVIQENVYACYVYVILNVQNRPFATTKCSNCSRTKTFLKACLAFSPSP